MQRYTLDLSDFFADHRAKTFVHRKTQWKRVGCLLDHVRSTFQIKPDCYLTNEADVYFPEAEDLDVIHQEDLIRVRVSNSGGTQQKGAPKKVSIQEPRAQNGKRKHVSSSSSDSSSDSEDDDDDGVETLPKIFAGVEKKCKTKDDEEKLEAKPKRKRVRKRKSKKKVEESPPPKVVVKTYGKTKTPPIVLGNGDSSGHVRFEESDKDEEVAPVKVEPYRNLNRTVTPRVVKAVRVENGPSWNEDIPAIPNYDVGSVAESNQVVKSRPRKSTKKSVEIKQETIEVATRPPRDSSPTWDTEAEVTDDPAKESFIASYSGEEFWDSLRSSVDCFPSIPFPSVNDVIACTARGSGESYLAFVERVDEGDASRLTLRRLNCSSSSSATSTEAATLKQLAEIRLVATYQPA